MGGRVTCSLRVLALLLLLPLVLALALAACGGGEVDGTTATPRAAPSTPAPTAVTPTPSGTATPTPSAADAEAPGQTGSPTPTKTPTPPSTATPPPAAAAAPEEGGPLPAAIRDLLDEVAELRGLEPPPNLRAFTVARPDVREVYTGRYTEGDLDWLDKTTDVYRLLGHLEKDQTLRDVMDSFVGLVLGFYRPSEKTLWVVTEQEGVGLEDLNRGEQQTLVHELLHALQDYHFDLGTTFFRTKDNLDADLAFTAVLEGDAVVHTDRHALRFLIDPGGGGRYFLGAARQLGDIPPPIIRAIYFPYTTGADWVAEVIAKEGVEALNAFLTEPPPATTLILHPELLGTGWEPERLFGSVLPLTDIAESLGTNWRAKSWGSLGEFHLLNYLLGDAPYYSGWLRAPGSRTAVDAAAGWAGDSYLLYEDIKEGRVLVAVVRFVSEEEAREFAEVHRAVATKGAEVVDDGVVTLATQADGRVTALLEPVGRDVIFAIGTNAEVVRAAVEPLVEG